jgi:cytochrome c5
MKKTAFILSTVLMIAGCSAKLILPSQVDADRMNSKYPGYTLAELNEGKALYEAHCGNCHGLKKPSSHTEQQWSGIVPDMVRQVNKKAGKDLLNRSNEESILRYVVTMGGEKK